MKLTAKETADNAAAERELAEAVPVLHDYELEQLMSGEQDIANCYVTIHAGAGGTEACDWADMLFRLYTRWAERHGMTTEIADFQEGDSAGIRSVTFKVNGPYAYGNLQTERGIHRLVRISPFDAAKKRHTSFASLDCTPELTESAEKDRQYGEKGDIAWDSHIRSYVFQPYQMVKDHRTGCTKTNVAAVMDGDIDEFIEWKRRSETPCPALPIHRASQGPTL